jgi:hypothetical protein
MKEPKFKRPAVTETQIDEDRVAVSIYNDKSPYPTMIMVKHRDLRDKYVCHDDVCINCDD